MLKQNSRLTTYPSATRTKVTSAHTAPQRRGSPSNIRVLRTNLVYAIGLWPQICSQPILAREDYFGKYGTVLKVAINKKPNIDKKQLRPPSYSAVITYDNEVSASLALLSLFEFKSSNGLMIRCCYGCTKYCDIFYNGKSCNKHQCPYMHEFDEEREINLANGQRYQDYDFERHFSMAADIVMESMRKITETFGRAKLNRGLFPDPYDSLKILIDHEYLSYEEYEEEWQKEPEEKEWQPQGRKCRTESCEIKQDPCSSESGSIENQQQIVYLDMQQSIYPEEKQLWADLDKAKSNLDFVENKPASPRFIEQFRSFFGRREVEAKLV